MIGPLLGVEIPLITPVLLAFSIIHVRASITTKNRKGDNGSPCLIPFSHLNVKVGEPLTNTKELSDLRIPIIHAHLLL
ncbi:hypothetical protein Hdeb2414_s0007g00239951 [Helianthus debilis subsp. tardiflorus]